jgi:hypothetical protein
MASLQPRPQIVQPEDQSIRLVPLTQGKVAIIDADRYEWAMQWNWYAHYNRCTRSYYAARRGRRDEPNEVWLHRQLLGESEGDVDHINHQTLDNRMVNLRPATRAQNQSNRGPQSNNTSGCPGVYRSRNSWLAQIKSGGKQIYLGLFDNIDDAIKARQAGEIKYFGEYAFSARPQQLPPRKPPVSDGTACKSHDHPINAA